MDSRDQLQAGDTVEGIGTGDGSGDEGPADDMVLSGDVIQGRGGRGDKRRMVKVSSMARRVVRLYQALLALTLHREGAFARSFSSVWIRSTPTLMIAFDGCLEGIGIVWHSVSGTWEARRRRFSAQTVLGASAFSLRSMNFGGIHPFRTCRNTLRGW